MENTKTAAGNRNLTAARKAKNDEFYTRLEDIQTELRHYKAHFAGKTVLCNCDDPRVSEFTKYFKRNFAHLQLRRLISTCYKNLNPDMFSRHLDEKAVWLDWDGNGNGHTGRPRVFKGDGDFRGDECVALLKQADIVVTNPPFSLFREFVAQLIQYDKQFLILGNMNAIHYKEIFPLIRDNKVWLGPSIFSGGRWFGVPNYYPAKANSSVYKVDERGNQFYVQLVRWFTNMDIQQRHLELPLWKEYTPADCPKYDNYDAVNVDKARDIPYDYPGVMGVPDSFLDKYCPEQFEILGMLGNGKINGKAKYSRILIKHRKPAKPWG